MRENQEFEVGDWVIHHFHGVGKIENIVEKGLDGNEKTYYKVVTPKMEYWIPKDGSSSDHIEHVRSKAQFQNMLKILSEAPQAIAKHHKTRKKRIHQRWVVGTLSSRAKLLRDLNGRYRLKKLSFSEKEMMKKVNRYLVNEWIIADDEITRGKARKKIKEALKQSVQKARKSEEV